MSKHLFAGIATLILLQGCAAVVVGAGAGVASVAHDRRTLGTQVDDKTLAGKLSAALDANTALKDQANINLHVFNGVALLVGQAPSENLRQQAQAIAEGIQHIRRVHNQIRVAQPIPASTAAHDVWLASKVRANLLADDRVDGLHISVTVEDSEVFLMGLVNASEAAIAVDVSRNISGVARVYKVFETL